MQSGMSSATLLQIEEGPQRTKAQTAIERERGAQRLVTAFILTGLAFMLLPGTFLGVWNLISISESRSVTTLSPAWIQAHGHAQIFGWIGTFILGIGLYSLQKMRRSVVFPLSHGWICWALWSAGVLLRWSANIYAWHWRLLLPISGLLELAAFLLFQRCLRRHRKSDDKDTKSEAWMSLVVSSTFGFLISLVANAVLSITIALRNSGPAFPHDLDQRLLVLSTWGFLVLAIWGFNAKWLPVFLGLKTPSERGLIAALLMNAAGVLAALLGFFKVSALLLLSGAVAIMLVLHIFEAAQHPPKTLNVHPSFPIFVRFAYVWLGIAALLGVWATTTDRAGGIWGASRHALTVGFIAAMVFAIGQRVLPAFCGMKILFSPAVMLWSLVLLNIGCLLRVASEIPAYEGYWRPAWHVLPVSAVTELLAVTLFAINIAASILKPMARSV
jgi:uncharacterized protein involved in response to NO